MKDDLRIAIESWINNAVDECREVILTDLKFDDGEKVFMLKTTLKTAVGKSFETIEAARLFPTLSANIISQFPENNVCQFNKIAVKLKEDISIKKEEAFLQMIKKNLEHA